MTTLIGGGVVIASLLLYVQQALRFNLGGMLVAAVIGCVGGGIFIAGLFQ